jgi:hypothetical protein
MVGGKGNRNARQGKREKVANGHLGTEEKNAQEERIRE